MPPGSGAAEAGRDPRRESRHQPGWLSHNGNPSTWDLTVSAVANIGPGIDFYFAFGVIAVTARVAAPIRLRALASTVRLHPSETGPLQAPGCLIRKEKGVR